MSIHRVTITGTYMSQKMQNVLHLNNPDGATSDSAILIDIRDNLVNQLQPLQNAGYAYNTVSTQRVDSGSHAPVALDISGRTGSLAGAGYHPAIAMLFTIRTGTASRAGRGRFYLGGVHGESIQNGAMHPSQLGVMAAKAVLITNRFGPSGGSPLRLGVYNPGSGGPFLTMTQLVARNYTGLQRRRSIGVGI